MKSLSYLSLVSALISSLATPVIFANDMVTLLCKEIGGSTALEGRHVIDLVNATVDGHPANISASTVRWRIERPDYQETFDYVVDRSTLKYNFVFTARWHDEPKPYVNSSSGQCEIVPNAPRRF